MAIKVGNSYVSEAAYAYASQKTQTNRQMLGHLSNEFKDAGFTTDTAPFRGTGCNNIAIAPNILREMESSPEKRLEYEAIIYDCNSIQKTLAGKTTLSGSKITAQGFIIDAKGGLSSWSISQPDNVTSRNSVSLSKSDSRNWLARIREDRAAGRVDRYV